MTILDRDHTSVVAFAVGVGILLAASIMVSSSWKPPNPRSADTPSTYFSAGRAENLLERLVGDETPHPVGSPANDAVRARIVAELERLGYPVEIQKGLTCSSDAVCAEVSNVIAELPGSDSSAVLVAAHYDSVPAGPGAADDMSGVAAILEMAGALRSPTPKPFRHSILFLFTDGEEAGSLGAKLFVDHSLHASRVFSAINLEARGTSGPSIMFETGPANQSAVELFSRAIRRPNTNSIYYAIYKMLPNDTDFSIFKAHGYEGYGLAFIDQVNLYHTQFDTVANLNIGSLQHQGDNALALVKSLASADVRDFNRKEAVYFTPLSRFTLYWPADWSRLLAVCAVALLGAAIAVVLRRRLLDIRQLAHDLLILPAAVGLAAGLATSVFMAMRWAELLPGWVQTPAALLTLSCAISLFSVGVIAALLASGSNFWSVWIATWAWYALLACFLVWILPAVSYPLIVPLIVATLFLVVYVLMPHSRLSAWIGWTIPFLAGTIVGLQTLWPLYAALGTQTLLPNTIILTVYIVPLAPTITLIPKARWLVPLTAAAVALVSSCALMLYPPFLKPASRRLNLTYAEDLEHKSAKLLADPNSNVLPSDLSALAPFTDHRSRAFEWSDSDTFIADTRIYMLAGPLVDAERLGSSSNSDLYQLTLRSSRNAPVVTLLVPVTPDLQLLSIRNGQESISLTPHHWTDRWLSVTYLTTSPDGVNLILRARNPRSIGVYVLDQTYGIPPEAFQFKQPSSFQESFSDNGQITVVSRLVHLDLTRNAPTKPSVDKLRPHTASFVNGGHQPF